VLRASGLSDKGRIRPTNEDCFAIQEDLGLCVVADGMGGHNAGEVAARIAVESVVEVVRSRESAGSARPSAERVDDRQHVGDPWPFGYDPSISESGNLLRTAIQLANVQILEAARTDDRYAGMGTTIVAARVWDGRLTVAHAGDSRLYVVDGRGVRPMTLDDSWMATVLARDPAVDPLLLQHHPMRNALTNVVGTRARADVHVIEAPLAGGEWLLLTTDGVHGVLDERRMLELVHGEEQPCAIAKSLVTSALIRGSRDNCTAVVARYAA